MTPNNRIEQITQSIEEVVGDAYTDGYHEGQDEAWDEARNKGYDEGFDDGRDIIEAIYKDQKPNTFVNYTCPRTTNYRFSILTKDNQDLVDLRLQTIMSNRKKRENMAKYASWAKFAPKMVYGGLCQPYNTPDHMQIKRVVVHARPNNNFTHYIKHDTPGITHFDVYVCNR